jgi:hypothetical protein
MAIHDINPIKEALLVWVGISQLVGFATSMAERVSG